MKQNGAPIAAALGNHRDVAWGLLLAVVGFPNWENREERASDWFNSDALAICASEWVDGSHSRIGMQLVRTGLRDI
jgi:hypothetical protein